MSIEETRNKIVSVADKLFSRFGFQKTSMDEIAKTSRKAKGSLYYHFSSKEELFREVVEKELDNLKAKMSEVVNNNDYTPQGKLSQYMLMRMEGMQEASNYHETIKPDVYDHFEFMDDLRQEFDNWEKASLSAIINEGIEKDTFEIEMDVDVLAEMFIMIARGLEIPFYLQGKYEEHKDHFEGMARMLLKGMSK